MNNIKIQNVQVSQTLGRTWDLSSMIDSITKDPLFITVGDDILALSAALYRLTNAGTSHKFSHLSLSDESGELAKQVNDLDRAKAEKIRKFYKDKIMLLSLKGVKLSKFRQELSSFLFQESKYTYEHKYIGMAYRLPYFYEYDNALIDIFGSNYFDLKGQKHLKCEKKLKFIRRLTKIQRHVNNHEYWFTDENDDRIMISIQMENPLLQLFERYIEQDQINMNMVLFHKKNDSLNYYKAETYQFL